MTADQITLFAVLFAVFALLIWGRIRYDLVAFSALVAAVVLGVVPVDNAFDGFGHPATIVIALVLIVSRGLSNAGVVDLIARWVMKASTSLFRHISIMSTVAALLSAVMNNVAALALLMPVDIKTASKAGRSPALTLMPLSFASILGGMITLIGTPPNIIIAAYREESLGEAFSMFDFAPVGLMCAAAGIFYVTLIGWRLLPKDRGKSNSTGKLFDLAHYVAEVRVVEESKIIGQQVRHLDELCDSHNISIAGLIRNGRRLPGGARRIELQAEDTLILDADAHSLDGFVAEAKLDYQPDDQVDEKLASEDLVLIEAVVPTDARIVGRSARSLQLLNRYSVTLMGISRQGKRIRQQIRSLEIKAGDVLLLMGPEERLSDIVEWIGALPLADRELELIQHKKAGLAVGLFSLAILAASLGWLYLPIALALVCIAFIGFGIIRGSQVYQSIEWSVIVLLGAMIPLGSALEQSGGTELLVNSMVSVAGGYGPVAVLTIFMIVTMTLSDVLNNTATTIIAAPIGVGIASSLGVNADPFLMATAVAASCAFLTPIGHKNNTLIMGPGGYRFGDYWRMGLPLEILIVAVGVPSILMFWPL
ncbi:MAG: di/tricarboxylate transporter [Parasphingorhabdus sp.]